MMEVAKEVRTERVEYICDECCAGKMRFTGMVLDSFPPQYPHECDRCGAMQTFHGKKYPLTRYVTVESPEPPKGA